MFEQDEKADIIMNTRSRSTARTAISAGCPRAATTIREATFFIPPADRHMAGAARVDVRRPDA
jgi:hypothetical protein